MHLTRTTVLVSLAVTLSGCTLSGLPFTITRGERLDAYLAEDATRPTVVVDLDDTVVDGSWWSLLKLILDVGYQGTDPLPGAAQTLRGVSGRFHVVFVTARDDSLADQTLEWLRRHEFPDAPVVFSSSLLLCSEAKERYKTAAISALGARGLRLLVGVGDRPSDIGAYARHGLRKILVAENLTDPDVEEMTLQLDDSRFPTLAHPWDEAWTHIDKLLSDIR